MAAKDGRFYLRLNDEDRRMFDDVAEALGFGDTSSALRFLVREKHRELFGVQPPAKRPRPKPAK